MFKINKATYVLGSLAGLLMARAAVAHPGHDTSGLIAGAIHPLTGADHLAAMIAVGLWASQLGKKALWAVPLTFVAMMGAGMGLALAGLHLPMVEQGITASVLVLGLLVLFAFKMPTWASMALVGSFAILHGWAHGSEMHAGASALSYGVGMAMSTAFLHLVGAGLGFALVRLGQQKIVRVAGAGVVLCSILLMTGVL